MERAQAARSNSRENNKQGAIRGPPLVMKSKISAEESAEVDMVKQLLKLDQIADLSSIMKDR
jgi:hypothetical protein